jgi:hypothetical protein
MQRHASILGLNTFLRDGRWLRVVFCVSSRVAGLAARLHALATLASPTRGALLAACMGNEVVVLCCAVL